jgi:hypothetical protein
MPLPNHRQLLEVGCRLWEQLVVALGAHVLATRNLRVRESARTTRACGWPKHRLNPPLLASPLLAPTVKKGGHWLQPPQMTYSGTYNGSHAVPLKPLSPFSHPLNT